MGVFHIHKHYRKLIQITLIGFESMSSVAQQNVGLPRDKAADHRSIAFTFQVQLEDDLKSQVMTGFNSQLYAQAICLVDEGKENDPALQSVGISMQNLNLKELQDLINDTTLGAIHSCQTIATDKPPPPGCPLWVFPLALHS